jgi:hypothetical protein
VKKPKAIGRKKQRIEILTAAKRRLTMQRTNKGEPSKNISQKNETGRQKNNLGSKPMKQRKGRENMVLRLPPRMNCRLKATTTTVWTMMMMMMISLVFVMDTFMQKTVLNAYGFSVSSAADGCTITVVRQFALCQMSDVCLISLQAMDDIQCVSCSRWLHEDYNSTVCTVPSVRCLSDPFASNK